ncbi:MAG: hypothetical protein ACOYEV_10415 [Candidatus Nanopelagicales bacterium]
MNKHRTRVHYSGFTGAAFQPPLLDSNPIQTALAGGDLRAPTGGAEVPLRVLAAHEGRTSPTLEDLADLLVLHERRRVAAGSSTEQTAELVCREIGRLLAWSQLEGAETLSELSRLAEAWIESAQRDRFGNITAAGPRVISRRESVVRRIFETLRTWDLTAECPAVDRRQARPEARPVLPLSDEDLAVLTMIASDLLDTAYAATLALMAAGVVTGEACRIAAIHVSLEAGTVSAPGTSRVRARTLSIRRDHLQLLRYRVEQAPVLFGNPERPLIYGGNGGAAKQTSFAATVIKELFGKAGIEAQPKDLTAWAARNAAKDGGLPAAAHVLGTDNIARVARVVGYSLSEGA